MNIAQVNASQSFKGLNFENVSTLDREHFIKSNFKILKQLGKKYDINLTSCYEGIPGFSSIDIEVKPAYKAGGFITKFFRPTGRSQFYVEYTSHDKPVNTTQDFMKSIDEAISDLKNKLGLH